MDELITGYQFGPIRGEFRCVYEFPNNLDKEEIHMPPYTTLVPPPTHNPSGMIPCWNGTSWVLEVDDISIKAPEIPESEYGKLLPEFAADQIRFGLWSQEQYDKWKLAYDVTLAAIAAEEAQLAANGPPPIIDRPVVEGVAGGA